MRAREERIARAGATALAALLLAGALPVAATARAPLMVATPVGPEQVVFAGPRQGCDANDIPDAPLRAFRLPDGRIAAFGLHHDNRRLVGPNLSALAPECAVVFAGRANPDPARFDDRIWIAATHTADGVNIEALGHAEYHADTHRRCPQAGLACLWASVIALRSGDGGKSFVRLPAPVAVPGLRAEAEQGRHRGFFNPTNIVMKDGAAHFMVAQTGWAGQPFGVCLFRAERISAGRWRAFDGKGFNAAFPSPYAPDFAPQGACAPLAPFPLVPGAVVRHRATGLWLALFPANKGMNDRRGGTFAASGFYLAASRDLIAWSAPTLVMAAPILGESPCGQAAIAAYPVLIDEASPDRNFADVGDVASLAYVRIATKGCALAHERTLVLRKVRITAMPAP